MKLLLKIQYCLFPSLPPPFIPTSPIINFQNNFQPPPPPFPPPYLFPKPRLFGTTEEKHSDRRNLNRQMFFDYDDADSNPRLCLLKL